MAENTGGLFAGLGCGDAKVDKLFDAAAWDLVVGAPMEREAERRVHPVARLMHGEGFCSTLFFSFSSMSSPGGCGGLAAQKFVQLLDVAAWALVARAQKEREVVRRDGRLGEAGSPRCSAVA
jgi:hypothetical protein